MTDTCIAKQQSVIETFIQNVDTTVPYINSVYYDKIEPLFKQYKESVSGDSLHETDSLALTKNTTTINNFITSELLTNPNFPALYPYLYDRIQEAAFITPAEVYTIIDTSFLTQDTVIDYAAPRDSTIPTICNNYYSPGSFNGGGAKSFCSLVPNIFAAYTNLTNAFTDIQLYANKLTNILSAIEEFSLASLLDNLKQQALNIIDQIIAKVKAKISQITGLFAKISNFKFNLNQVFSKMHQEKQKIDEVISDPSVKNLKDAISGAIGFASSLFESSKLEEIQFLILRFCELISGIENFFDDLTKPLEDIPGNFKKSFDFLQAAGYGGTARAIAAGAFRPSSSERSAISTQIDNLPATVAGGNGVTFGDEGIAVNGGVGIRRRAYRIQPITEEEVAILNNELTAQNVLSGGSNHIELSKGTSYNIDKDKVWSNVRPLEKIMLYRLSLRIGKKLYINSAYRSSYAQSIINPSVKASWHSSGQAFDVSMRSYSGMSFEQFKGYANSVGFSRVRPYNDDGFVHIDTGPPGQMW